jgi:hypothetical protein
MLLWISEEHGVSAGVLDAQAPAPPATPLLRG